MSDMMVHNMTCYMLVPEDEGRPGYEREPVYVAANSFTEALAIVDNSPPPYSIKGIVIKGQIRMNIHKLPEAKA